ncbi:hypothetical protein ASD64_20265 [Mesorhizobium sp. Root157]|nr:hypothetical protein ASD64_20265 [Mesorhizobium sp. Root157]
MLVLDEIVDLKNNALIYGEPICDLLSQSFHLLTQTIFINFQFFSQFPSRSERHFRYTCLRLLVSTRN